MIVSHEHQLVFVHNPKVAGSAIRLAMEHLHDDEMKFWHQGFVPELDRVVDLAHITFKDLLAFRPQCKDYRVIGVIRDPYERFVSGLQEYMRQHSHPIEDINRWVNDYMDETNFRYNWKYVHLCPQHYFFDGAQDLTLLQHENLGNIWSTFQAGMKAKGIHIKDLPTTRVRPDTGRLSVKHLSRYVIGAIGHVYHRDFLEFGFVKRSGEDVSKYLEHYERVNGIHSPYIHSPKYETLNEGEKIAYKQQNGDGLL